MEDKAAEAVQEESGEEAQDTAIGRVDGKKINDLAEKLAAAVPDDLQEFRADLEHNFRGLLSVALEKMELVTREEFDVQSKVLARTREKLERLEQELEELQHDASS